MVRVSPLAGDVGWSWYKNVGEKSEAFLFDSVYDIYSCIRYWTEQRHGPLSALLWYNRKIILLCFLKTWRPWEALASSAAILWRASYGREHWSFGSQRLSSKKLSILNKQQMYCIYFYFYLCPVSFIHMWKMHYSLNSWPICGWRDKSQVETIVDTELKLKSTLFCVSAHWRLTYSWTFWMNSMLIQDSRYL